jgi:hypothetical protein
MLIKLVDGKPEGHPVLQSNFLQLFPSISFSLPLLPADVEPHGYGIYEFSQQPEPGRYEKVIEKAPVRDDESGIWFQRWEVEDQTDEEKAESDANAARVARLTRNGKLLDTDYTQLADAPVDRQAWQIYREALRQVSEQDGFPWDVIWPEEPAAGNGPDYNTFYNGLLIGPVYQVIRAQAMESLSLTVACTEFVAAIADAKVGVPNPQALQACIDNIVETATLGETELDELRNLLTASGLDSIYTIQ